MSQRDSTLLSKLGFSDNDKKDKRHDLACAYLAQEQVLARILPEDEIKRLAALSKNMGKHRSWGENPTISSTKLSNISYQTEYPLSKGFDQYKTTIGFLDGVINCDLNVSGEAVEERRASSFMQLADARKLQSQDPNIKIKKIGGLSADPKVLDAIRGNVPVGDFTPGVHDDTTEQVEVVTTTEVIFPWTDIVPLTLNVEVKIASATVGDILRQIKLYQEYTQSPKVDKYLHNARQPPPRTQLWVLAAVFDVSDTELELLDKTGIHFVRLGDGFAKWIEDILTVEPSAKRRRIVV